MSETVEWALAYFGAGLFVATAFGCWCKGRDRHLADGDLAAILLVLMVWPIVVLAVPVALCVLAFETVKTTKWWKKLPDSDDMYPVEWLFCWPVKLYELWRKRHGRQKGGDK